MNTEMKMNAETKEKKIAYGIGGWLILPILGFILTIALSGYNFWQVLTETEGLTAIFTASAEAPLAALKIPVAASMIGGVLIMLSAAYCLVLIYTRSKSIRNMATAHYLILACVVLVELWGDNVISKAVPEIGSDPKAIREAIRGVLIAAIWIPYFQISKRVRNTFTK